MSRLALFLIGVVTPAVDRESVVGDTVERFNEIRATDGDKAARRWLRRETRRVLAQRARSIGWRRGRPITRFKSTEGAA